MIEYDNMHRIKILEKSVTMRAESSIQVFKCVQRMAHKHILPETLSKHTFD